MTTPQKFLKKIQAFQRTGNSAPTWITTIEEDKILSHTIWICTINNAEVVEHMVGAIVGLGVNVSSAAANNTLFHEKPGSQTTIVALTLSNLNRNLKNSDILDKICSAINHLDYYGIVIQKSNGGSAWRAGNISSGKNIENTFNKAKDLKDFEENKEVLKETSDDKKPMAQPAQPVLGGKEAVRVLTSIVRATCEISDVFFDNIPQQDRKLLARELEKICESNEISLDDLPKL